MITHFHTKLAYEIRPLYEPKQIVACSFIAHKSVTPLDLSISELSLLKAEISNSGSSGSGSCIRNIPLPNTFFSSEEDCRKKLNRNRHLLYTLNLDLPVNREGNLKLYTEWHMSELNFESPILDKIVLNDFYYQKILEDYLVSVVEKADEKLKALRSVLKPLKFLLKVHNHFSRFNNIGHLFLGILYHERADSDTVKEFLSAFDFQQWLTWNGEPRILEFILHRAEGSRCKILDTASCEYDLINGCIQYKSVLLNIQQLLKYRNAPRFTMKTYKEFQERILLYHEPDLTRDVLRKPVSEGKMSVHRNYLLQQLLWVSFNIRRNINSTYLDDIKNDATNILCLVWRTVPDSFLSRYEIEDAYGVALDENTLEPLYILYKEAIGGEVPRFCKPRTLAHYSRIVIRKILSDNQQLSEGISQLCLPTNLASFLRLQE